MLGLLKGLETLAILLEPLVVTRLRRVEGLVEAEWGGATCSLYRGSRSSQSSRRVSE